MKDPLGQFNPSDPLQSPDQLKNWKERIIRMSSLGIAILSTGIYGFNLYSGINTKALIWIGVSTLIYLLVILITFLPIVSYRLKTALILVSVYSIGLFSAIWLENSGISGLCFVVLNIFTVLLLGRWAGLLSVAFGSFTLILLRIGLNNAWIPGPIQNNNVSPNSIWTITSIILLMVGTLSVFIFQYLLNTLISNLQDKLQVELEQREDREKFEIRNQKIKHRDNQIRTISEISSTIRKEDNLEQVFLRVVNLLKEQFELYFAGIFSVDPGRNHAVIKAGTGETGQEMLEAGFKLTIDDKSSIGWAISKQQTRIDQNIGTDTLHITNPYLPNTRSEIAFPLITGDSVFGALSIHSEKTNAFDDEDIIVLQGIADNLAIGIQNSQLHQQSETFLEEIRKLNQQYFSETWPNADGEPALRLSYENPLFASIPDYEISTHSKQISIRENVIGNLIFESDKKSLDKDDEVFIDAVIDQVAIALENVRLMDVTQKSAQRDRMIANLSSKVWASTDIEMILQTALRELVQGLQATHGLILLDKTD